MECLSPLFPQSRLLSNISKNFQKQGLSEKALTLSHDRIANITEFIRN